MLGFHKSKEILWRRWAISPKMPTRNAMHHVHLSLSCVGECSDAGRKEGSASESFLGRERGGNALQFSHTLYDDLLQHTITLSITSRVKCGVAYRKSLPGGQKM